ncbi:MAG TPA: hypothetical protein VIS75_02845 [Chitinophagaceae bacterium]
MKNPKLLALLLLSAIKLSAVPCQGQFNFYKFSTQIDSTFNKDISADNAEFAGTFCSFIGQYQKALYYFEQAQFANRKVPTKDQLSDWNRQSNAILSSYKPTSAKEFILQEAKKTRIVIINEAHHIPLHRIFAESLLADLKKQGYNFIGFEDLALSSILLQNKYPVIGMGYYSTEPCFSNMIRTSLKLGFTPFGYEAKAQGGKEREIGQAENIKKLIDKNPQAKFIIYCGYSHALEDSTHNGDSIHEDWGLAMAGRLKRMTGIDPLTIDQVELTETGTPYFDNYLRQSINLPYPAVFINKNGIAFGKANSKKQYDVNVYHPDTKYINGRPGWLYYDDKVAVSIVDKINIAFPTLVFAYDEGEDTGKAIPVDVIELRDKYDSKKLILYNNTRYEILIKNIAGEKQLVKALYEQLHKE